MGHFYNIIIKIKKIIIDSAIIFLRQNGHKMYKKTQEEYRKNQIYVYVHMHHRRHSSQILL